MNDMALLKEQLDQERGKVKVSSHDFSVRELVRMLRDDELNIAPEYQRKYRWDEELASRFIESIFLGLPVPPIFVATNDSFSWEVVDGVQRLATLAYYLGPAKEFDFLQNKSELRLKGLESLDILNGLSYSDIPKELQIYFNRQPLQVVSLTDQSDADVRFDLFSRLNSGAVTLTAQEVRSCVYRGPFKNFIEMLAEDKNFKSLLKLQKKNRNDGTDVEQVLKFFAYKNRADEYDGAVTDFLNRFMSDVGKGEQPFDYEREQRLFADSVSHLSSCLGGEPLLRDHVRTTPLVQLEACLNGIARVYESGAEPVHPNIDWRNDSTLVKFSKGGSNTKNYFDGRNRRAYEIFSGE